MEFFVLFEELLERRVCFSLRLSGGGVMPLILSTSSPKTSSFRPKRSTGIHCSARVKGSFPKVRRRNPSAPSCAGGADTGRGERTAEKAED